MRNTDSAEIAKAMFTAMRKFQPSSLETVRVIIFQKDMVSIFLSTLKSIPQGIFTQAKDFFKGKFNGKAPWIQIQCIKEMSVSFNIS